MTRFKSLFGRTDEEKKKPANGKQKGAVGNALDEIEAEESKVPEVKFLEDELVDLEREPQIIAPPPRREPPMPRPIAEPEVEEETTEYVDSRVDEVEDLVKTMRGESRNSQAQLSHMQEEMDRLVMELGTLSSRLESIGQSKKAISVKIEPKRRPEAKAEDTSDLPTFTPYGARKESMVEMVDAEPVETFVPYGLKGVAPAVQQQFVRPAFYDDLELIKAQPEPKKTLFPIPGVGMPILSTIKKDYLTLVSLMRWVEFLFERTPRKKLSLVLDYYRDVGWISDDVKSEIMSYARGEMQDVTKYIEAEEAIEESIGTPQPEPASYKKVDDWRLSADDHLKSLLFIMNIAGIKVDKDKLNSLELTIQRFKESLENYHGV